VSSAERTKPYFHNRFLSTPSKCHLTIPALSLQHVHVLLLHTSCNNTSAEMTTQFPVAFQATRAPMTDRTPNLATKAMCNNCQCDNHYNEATNRPRSDPSANICRELHLSTHHHCRINSIAAPISVPITPTWTIIKYDRQPINLSAHVSWW
jgi:hypothetical protein